jgi:hypothetical protein
MQEFLSCYANGFFGVAYLILGIVTIAVFGMELVGIKRDMKDGIDYSKL